MPTNPFQYLDPVRPETFAARWPLVKQIALDLVLDGGNSHAIIAGRRCGKSSLLVALANQLGQPATTSAGDWEPLAISFDFKSGEFSSAGSVFSRLLRETVRRTDVNVRRRPADAWTNPVTLNAPWFEELAKSEDVTLQEFEDCVGYVLDQLTLSGQHIRLVFLIDEIDDALDETWTESLFNQMRALVYSGDLKSQIRLVFSGSHRFLEQVSRRGSPLWNILKLHYLDPFDERGFQELFQRSPELSEDVLSMIWDQSGGHPFIAQYLAHHLWDSGCGFSESSAGRVNQLAGRFMSEQIHDIEGWAQGIGVAGFHAYSVLTTAPDWMEEREILRAVNSPDLNMKRGLLALCYHGLVIHDDSYSHYKLASKLFESWFINFGPAYLKSSKVPEATIQQIVNITAQTAVFGTNAHIQQDQTTVGNIANSHGIAIGTEANAEVMLQKSKKEVE